MTQSIFDKHMSLFILLTFFLIIFYFKYALKLCIVLKALDCLDYFIFFPFLKYKNIICHSPIILVFIDLLKNPVSGDVISCSRSFTVFALLLSSSHTLDSLNFASSSVNFFFYFLILISNLVFGPMFRAVIFVKN